MIVLPSCYRLKLLALVPTLFQIVHPYINYKVMYALHDCRETNYRSGYSTTCPSGQSFLKNFSSSYSCRLMHLILVFVIFMFYVVFKKWYGMRCYSNHRYGVTMTPLGALVTPAKGVTVLTPLGRGVQLAQAIDTPFWCYHNTFVFTVWFCLKYS